MAFNYTKKDANKYGTVIDAKTNLDSLGEYKESDNVANARNAVNTVLGSKPSDWAGGSYGDAVKAALDKINNREAFSYDLNGDALYNQYKNQYMTQGRMAMADTIGQASAMTGGYGNSYAASAGNQAYQGYLQQLNDRVPELYGLAYDRYNQEGQDLLNQYSMYNDQYNSEYGRYRDTVSDWNTSLNRADSNLYNERTLDRNAYDSDRSYLSDAYKTALGWATDDANSDYSNQFNAYQQGVAESQWQQEYALSQKTADQSSTIDALKQQLGNGVDIESATKLKGKILSAAELKDKKIVNSRGNEMGSYMIDGKRYGSYDDYVKQQLEDAYNSGDINMNTLYYLTDYYFPQSR